MFKHNLMTWIQSLKLNYIINKLFALGVVTVLTLATVMVLLYQSTSVTPKVLGTSNMQWPLNGLRVDNATASVYTSGANTAQYGPAGRHGVADNAGGAFFAFETGGNVIVQRIDSSGAKVWVQVVSQSARALSAALFTTDQVV
ncbi:MAG: hypothetical protein TR69_WS6001000371 [candidate division WS6 bacterium OLB20]|uniref:Uncharacterized protein n=1 Tax=candidate division WS6 bacterium OLB20 TaxID=1617426 RepID=A0A136LXJ6_9BACT|nr:MAG: hypothetical protein TR69_WS6001000371 [candidate division WS6 bacterium OLB20]